MTMNKRGFLLGEETLKIVIAVICIIFLIYILVALYFSITGEQNLKFAENNMKNLISPEINRIDSGGNYSEQGILIPNPADWTIFSFIGNDQKPNSCVQQNCICICETAFPDLFDWQIKRCDEKGSCSVISNLKKFDKIKIEKAGTAILIQKINGQIEIKKK